MANTNLDLDCLRTFVAILDTGSFARAGERVGRSLSAVSLQVDKLEGQVNQALFRKQGRRMVASEAGERLRDHARAILAANDAALGALRHDRLSGTTRMGVLHDVLEAALAEALNEFVTSHPQVRLEIVVERSRTLLDMLDAGDLDQVVAFELETRQPSDFVARVPMVWVGQRLGLQSVRRPLPLILVDEPCAFRRAALTALDDAGIPWRIVLTSPSLSAVRAAVRAGLGVTVRTPHFVGRTGAAQLAMLDTLPALPDMPLRHYRRTGRMSDIAAALKTACIGRLKVW